MDRFYIGYVDPNSGQQTNLKPYAIPEQAFEELDNAYVFRGRVRKRFGSRWFLNSQLSSRLRINVGTTDAGGNLVDNVRTIAADATLPLAVGQIFSIAGEIYTIVSNVPGPQPMLDTGITAVHTFDITNGNFVFNGGPALSVVYFYPALPVMGLPTFEDSVVNNDPTIAFDTRYAYQFVAANGGWERIAGEITPGAAVWTGNNAQFFWATTWTGTNAFEPVLFVTNFNENEPNFMRFLNSTTLLWDNFRPQIDATPNFLNSARILVPFKNRLLAFNTWEGPAAPLPGNNFRNRVRYSQVGSPLDALAWRQDIPGRGNAIDASTTEAIITVEFIKDRLIVYFERSTWELVYIGNQTQPFAWQKINTELGAESTFSIVPFDKVAIGVGNIGIHACNGANVERIDQKIPDTVFDIHNVDGGVFRVYGIRDYFVEMVYWTFPDEDISSDFPFPNKVLVYNYQTGTWAFNDDSITAFGYIFQPAEVGAAEGWSSNTVQWQDPELWNGTTLSALFRQVIAGNQEGYVFIIDAEETTNAPVLQITNLVAGAGNVITLTVINHNLRDGDFIWIQDIVGTGNLTLLNNKIFEVNADLTMPNTFTFVYPDPTVIIAGVYEGGGVIARVSQINIVTKEFNFYEKQGRNTYLAKVDFMVDTTAFEAQSQFDVSYFVSTSTSPLLEDSQANNAILGQGTLDTFPYALIPLEGTSSRVIHPVYFQADGEYVQLEIIMNDQQITKVVQITNPDGSFSYTGPALVDFQLHFLVIFAMASAYRFQ